jgi:hypothetical protein
MDVFGMDIITANIIKCLKPEPNGGLIKLKLTKAIILKM